MQPALPASRPSRATILRTIVAFLAKVGEEELKRVPLVGSTVTAVLELSNNLGGQQAEAKIEQLLAIGQQSEANIKMLTAIAQLVLAQQDEILAHFQTAGWPADREQIQAVSHEAALIAYRNRLVFENTYADYRGVKGAARSDIAAALPVDGVYIMPCLVAEGVPTDTQRRETELVCRLDDQDLNAEERMRVEVEYAELTVKRFRVGEKRSDAGQPALEVIQAHRHLVILGSPGVGKSALVRFLARTCALGGPPPCEDSGSEEAYLPVVIPLAAFSDARRYDRRLSLRAYLDQRMEQRGGQTLRQAVDIVLSQGRAMVLLDGIDEVPDSAARASIVRAVDSFLADCGANRIVVTSRPVGYIRIAGDIRHFVLPNFSEEQVNEFVGKWQRAQERLLHPEAPDMDRADGEAAAMLDEIRGNDKVAELTTNPLILVIVSLIRREGRRLPDKRVQLYQRAVETLMETWNQFRSLSEQVVGDALPVDRLTRVLGAVAAWSRATRPTGVMHRGELRRKLAEVIEELEFDEHDPMATADSYLDAAVRNSGILEERGADIFAFWHPTFEEYLAAVDLCTPASRAAERLLPHLDDPRWREVILLSVGYIGLIQGDGETATALVNAILNSNFHGNPMEPLLHQRLHLAAACIADDVGVRRKLAQAVIGQLAEVIARLPYDIHVRSFVQTVRGLPRVVPSEATIGALDPARKSANWEVRMEAARLLSNAAASNPCARELCAELVGDEDFDVRSHAALGLARAGDYRPEIWGYLSYGASSSYTYIQVAVEEFFNSAPPAALAAVHACLSADSLRLRLSAAGLLEKLGRADEAVVEALRAMLSAKEPWIRYRAAEMLEKLGRADEAVVEALRTLLFAAELGVRYRAAEMLEKLGRADESVVAALRAMLSAEEPRVRYRAAEILEKLGRADEAVVTALRALLSTEEPLVRYSAAGLLEKLGRADEAVVTALRAMLSVEEPWVRYSAAELLEKLGRADESVVTVLRSWLSAEEPEVRYSAAGLLETLGRADEAVVTALRAMLSAEEPRVRCSAAEMLEKLGRADESVVAALRALLSAKEPEVRYSAAEMLEKLGRADESAVLMLVEKGGGLTRGLEATCRALAHNVIPTPEGIQSLADWFAQETPRDDRAWLFHWVAQRWAAIQQAHANQV